MARGHRKGNQPRIVRIHTYQIKDLIVCRENNQRIIAFMILLSPVAYVEGIFVDRKHSPGPMDAKNSVPIQNYETEQVKHSTRKLDFPKLTELSAT